MGKKRSPFSQEHKDKIGKANSVSLLGHTQSSYTKEKRAKKLWVPILQFSQEGSFIKEWSCIKHAAEDLSIRRNNISSCLTEVYKTCGGYIWKYKQ
jgi:hypothetical protein